MDYIKLRQGIDEVLAGKRDEWFDDIPKRIHCMSTPRVYALINAIVRSMEPGENYVEIGTYQGGSMIAALRGHENKAIGVDSFAEFQTTNNAAQTQANFEVFGVADRVTLKEMDYKTFFAQVGPDFKMQVYNYDGSHAYEEQLAGIEAGWPFLKSGSIIIVDDFLYPEVNRAINQFIANHIDQVKILVAIDSMQETDKTWWNGVMILRVL